MMSDIIMWVIFAIIALLHWRFRGGGVIPCPDGFRKPIAFAVFGLSFALLTHNIWAGLLVTAGSFLPAITTPRPMFMSWHKRYMPEDVYIAFHNWLPYKAAYALFDPTKHLTLWAIIYAAVRGCYELFVTVPLAFALHNWWIAPLGLIAAVQGLVYYVAGKSSKDHATKWAEIGYGGVRGVIYGLAAWVIIGG